MSTRVTEVEEEAHGEEGGKKTIKNKEEKKNIEKKR